jgi:hypothetical protein
MTVGKDVSTLFTDVVNCIQTGEFAFTTLSVLLIPTHRQSRVEKIGLPLPDQLRQVST